MLVPSKILHQNNKFVPCRSSAPNFTRRLIVQDFFQILRAPENVCYSFIYFYLFIYLLIFLAAKCPARIYSLCFCKTSDGLYFFPINWLLLIVVDRQIRPEKQLWILCQKFRRIPTATSTLKFSLKLQPANMGFINSSRLKFSPDFQNTEEVSRGRSQELITRVVAQH